MAQRRMFSLTVIDTDKFLEMPNSSQLLYFHLAMRADDDGFVSSPKKIQKMVNCSEDDLRILIAKQFVIPFDSGICVIRHWRIHNYIQSDRYHETQYLYEKSQIAQQDNGAYGRVDTECIQIASNMDTQVRLGKDRLELGKVIYGNYVALTPDEYNQLTSEYGQAVVIDYIERLNGYIEQIGVKKANSKYKSHYAVIRNWYRNDKANGKDQQRKSNFNNFTSRYEKDPKYIEEVKKIVEKQPELQMTDEEWESWLKENVPNNIEVR